AGVLDLTDAGRRSRHFRRIGKRPPANDDEFRVGARARRAVLRRVLVRGRPTVLAPLADVTVHIIQAPGGAFLLPHGRVVAGGVVLEPAVFAQVGDLVAEGPACRGGGLAAILPLGLAGQADLLVLVDELRLAQLVGQLLAEVAGLGDVHHLDGV